MGSRFSGSAFCSALRRASTAFFKSGLNGPKFDPIDEAALYGPGVVAERRGQKYFGSSVQRPIKADPSIRPPLYTRLPFACQGNNDCAMPVIASG